MELKQALRLGEYPRLALVGAGGKSTALFQLAREFNPPVIACATTHLSLDQVQMADQHFIFERIEDTNAIIDRPLSGVVLLTGPIKGQRTTGLKPEIMTWLDQFCGYRSLPLLIEADGARQLPLKAPAAHEPVIPDFVDTIVVVAGLSGVGKSLSEQWVFRPERFAELGETQMGDEISSSVLGRVLVHPEGGQKGIPVGARRILLLNQADDPQKQAIAREIALLTQSCFDAAAISSLRLVSASPPPAIFSVIEPIAGIILAAGEASRYGEPKQLLPWHGKPLVWHVAQKALRSGLAPVIVVSGAYTDILRPALQDLPVDIIHNPEWRQGQSSSIKAGLNHLQTPGGGAIFLLADQPQVPEGLIRALVEIHSQTLSPIVAPLVQGQRANPVLFDRTTFKDFEGLSGDVGGRKLFSKYRPQWVEWHDELPLMDIDSPADYRKLQELKSWE
jgi:molybdenum cofactor cytidylyltransferase